MNQVKHTTTVILYIYFQTQTESDSEITQVFPGLAPLHSRKHLDFSMNTDQTAFRLEIVEMTAEEDCKTLALVRLHVFLVYLFVLLTV